MSNPDMRECSGFATDVHSIKILWGEWNSLTRQLELRALADCAALDVAFFGRRLMHACLCWTAGAVDHHRSLAPDRINVNNIAPGMVLAPMKQPALDDPSVLEEQVQSIPVKRAAQPREIARLTVYLASADADYATGQTFTLDGEHGTGRMMGQRRLETRASSGANDAPTPAFLKGG